MIIKFFLVNIGLPSLFFATNMTGNKPILDTPWRPQRRVCQTATTVGDHPSIMEKTTGAENKVPIVPKYKKKYPKNRIRVFLVPFGPSKRIIPPNGLPPDTVHFLL